MRAFLDRLLRRGLCGTKLIVSDDHAGLSAARPMECLLGRHSQLQQIPKLLNSETGVTHDAAERKCVDGVIPWDGQDTGTV